MENVSFALITVPAECSMPFLSLPLILKSCPLGSLISRRADIGIQMGFLLMYDSPLAPGAQIDCVLSQEALTQ